MHQLPYSKRMSGRLFSVSDGISRRTETELPDGARLDSELLFANDETFRERGTVTFRSGSDLRFRTVGTGQLTLSADPPLRHGTVTWELDGGSGPFEQASGRIASNFVVAADGAVEDVQLGLVFCPQQPELKGERT